MCSIHHKILILRCVYTKSDRVKQKCALKLYPIIQKYGTDHPQYGATLKWFGYNSSDWIPRTFADEDEYLNWVHANFSHTDLLQSEQQFAQVNSAESDNSNNSATCVDAINNSRIFDRWFKCVHRLSHEDVCNHFRTPYVGFAPRKWKNHARRLSRRNE